MIQRKPTNRLGTENGIIDVKQHPWFKNFPWIQLLKKNIASPFVPINVLNSNDYKDQISSSSQEENEDENRLLLRKKSVQQLFEGYTYYTKDIIKEVKEIKEKPRKESINATTAATHYSYLDEKDSHRGKPKNNNFFKQL